MSRSTTSRSRLTLAATVGIASLSSSVAAFVKCLNTSKYRIFVASFILRHLFRAVLGMIWLVTKPLANQRINVASSRQRNNTDTDWKIVLRGFIRTMGVGLSVKDQRAALSAAGLDMADEYGSVYLDDRDAAIASLMQGDKLVVASAACLGHPEHDILAALSAIGARGATVMDLETQTTIPWNPDAQAAVDFSIRGGTATRNAVAAKARRARTASGNLGGIPAVDWDQTKLKKLREMFDQNTPRQKMADMLGVSRPTLQRKLRDLGLVGSQKGADE